MTRNVLIHAIHRLSVVAMAVVVETISQPPAFRHLSRQGTTLRLPQYSHTTLQALTTMAVNTTTRLYSSMVPLLLQEANS
ncbi:hypothetical protein E3N88_42737 [Mikania micrantha]|uniref:Secreted protein n=1 Tax=Mikania micrantha TaxID=192012 RepID=A0A5N6LGY3_9ASTR|nr:hypothetical protein E3N88_42737 [Mikania micrantha]